MILYRSLWGVDPSNWSLYFQTLHFIGITGIEASLADINYEHDRGSRFFELIKLHNLTYIIGIYTSWEDYEGDFEDVDVQVHLQRFTAQLRKVIGLEIPPEHINCHAGSDDMSISESLHFFEVALDKINEIIGDRISLSFETHRGRILYSPWVAMSILEKFPNLKFTLDLSHWVVVTERLIKVEKIKPILKNTAHLHLRLGTRQTSQVSNPQLMDFTIRDYFEQCWRLAANYGAKTGCVEYGPAEYQPVGFNGEVEIELDKLISLESERLSHLFGKH